MECKYKCMDCGEKIIYPFNFVGGKECNKCGGGNLNFLWNVCPICEKALQKKHEGFVCKNFKCKIGSFKNGKGWCYLTLNNKFKEYFEIKLKNKITNYQNQKEWLQKRSDILRRDKFTCLKCGKKNSLHVHHILSRTNYPEFTFENENLITLCEDCHKKIHSNDKWRFS